MKDPHKLLEETRNERRRIAAKDEELAIRERTLIEIIGGSPEALPSQRANKPVSKGSDRTTSRAPKGLLQASIVKVLASGGEMTSKAIRGELKSAGYAYSLNTMQFSKKLAEMIAKNLVTSKPNGAHTTYRLKKK